jgi:gamma-glutamylcyclotransferase (GGCT)/AIG2-like uncharacterized protein YtfP
MSKIFVYGTLKRGHRAHAFLEDHNAIFLKEASTGPHYHLYKLGWFPGMVIDEYVDGCVQGELYEVTEDCLERLDMYEGAPHLFRREEIELDDGSKAISYLYMQEFTSSDRVEDGVWE